MGVDHTRLDGDSLVGDVDRKNAVHAGEADDNATRGWERAAGKSGACASGNKGNAMLGTDADDRLNFVLGARQDNRRGYSAKCSQSIAFVRLELISLRDNSVLTDDGTKVCQHTLGEELLFEFSRIRELVQHSCLVCRKLSICFRDRMQSLSGMVRDGNDSGNSHRSSYF